MRTIERSSAFNRDFKRAKAAPRHRRDLDSLVSTAVARLASDQVLPHKNRDHGLSGEWAGYRECHIKPDLLLIYSRPGTGTLRLARLGSHRRPGRLLPAVLGNGRMRNGSPEESLSTS